MQLPVWQSLALGRLAAAGRVGFVEGAGVVVLGTTGFGAVVIGEVVGVGTTLVVFSVGCGEAGGAWLDGAGLHAVRTASRNTASTPADLPECIVRSRLAGM